MTRVINFGVIGCGLMGREFASAAARWCHLSGLDFQPRILAACDNKPAILAWFQDNIPGTEFVTTDYHELLANAEVEAVYAAVPHHLHQQVYIDVIQSGKHLLGEKPFGIDLAANTAILQAASQRPNLLVRCSSEFPFFPGAYRISQWIREGRFGRIIDVEVGLWHSSDLNPQKAINWKRRTATNGEYGCMGDLGMHPLHIPLRYGWKPHRVRALLSKLVSQRPDKDGSLVPCDTWDNAILACDVTTLDQQFPMLASVKRIAPGHNNTWFIRINGMNFSAEFSTQYPKQIRWLPYTPGGEQAWHVMDVPHHSAYPVITGEIFEFGFSDAILQMWAAFCDELVHGAQMRQPFICATPEETAATHRLFTAALASDRSGQAIEVA